MQVFIDSPDSLLASFLSGINNKRLILITGKSGLGKTRWCLELAKHARTIGIQAGGLVSPAIFEGGRKTGIDLLDLGSGSKQHLATKLGETGNGLHIGKWHFDGKTLKWGNEILLNLASCELLILDELGPLELERGVGLTNGIELISVRNYRLACMVVRPSLLENAQARWPWGEIYFVDPDLSSEAPI